MNAPALAAAFAVGIVIAILLFVVGLLGAILSIGSAMVLALVIDGTIR